ncbi:natural cytotoxicity triggering receptor 3 isoform X2 [Cavia porcellus]|uniref:natural cytotoxicity triggering receptor 3 isoform X2 n=1 Tax=Cavia porcellus TaxID=10141 RepID=UPI002FDF37E3
MLPNRQGGPPQPSPARPLLPVSSVTQVPSAAPSDMAWLQLLLFISVHPASCDLPVYQVAEVHAREGAPALLPCSFNASQTRPAIGFVTWYRDTVAPGNEVKNGTPGFQGRLAPLASARFLGEHQAELRIREARRPDSGVYVCRVEVLGLGAGTGNGTRLRVGGGQVLGGRDRHPGTPVPAGPRAPAPALLLRAALFAGCFLAVAAGSALCFPSGGRCRCRRGSRGHSCTAVPPLPPLKSDPSPRHSVLFKTPQ